MSTIGKILRSLPDFKGKRRLARFVLKDTINSFERGIVNGRFECRYRIPNLKENIGFDIFINGVYESDTISYLNSILPANGKFLDIGANIGTILIPLCKQRPDIRAIGIEAAPWVFAFLQENITLNNIGNAKIFNNALFDKDDIAMDFFSPGEQYGKGSLSPVFSQAGVKVISRRIDTILKQESITDIDAIKADVEGFEFFVFSGASQLLTKPDSPDIIFEFVDWAEQRAMGLQPGAAQNLLKEYGYEIFTLDNGKRSLVTQTQTTGASDFLASKKYKSKC